METKWKIDTDRGGGLVYRMNDSLIFNDLGASKIESIGPNGLVWTRSYDPGQTFFPNHDCIGWFNNQSGTSTLEVLGTNGSLEWSYTERGMDACYPSDGNFYVHIRNGSSNNSMLCLNNDGTIKWRYESPVTIAVWGVCHDGTTIIDYDKGIWDI